MTAAPVRIAAFDLDDTVLQGDSHLLFVRYLAAKRLVPASLLAEVALYFALHRIGITLDVPKLYARVVLRGSRASPDALEKTMRDFATTRLRTRVREQARDAMARIREDGCHVVVLSASLEPIVAIMADELQADGLVGTKLAVDGSGRLAVDGELIYGEAKMRALQRYADQRFPAWRLEHAFGNDYGDRFLLQAAVSPVAVCPSPRLRAVAEQHGWPCVRWR